ncbi:hypothetical protein SKAU_G00356250 [Synaphobranchus kaupii]|uniref:Uncharacterized protein n=1 Tax=Synaphobranchus kaupii TaxID=118154 RepID=A0A9Q1EHD4_SYNKA|nr:hypothetical protein SKAU_G00356250 [Synaphobranchus kaupii]
MDFWNGAEPGMQGSNDEGEGLLLGGERWDRRAPQRATGDKRLVPAALPPGLGLNPPSARRRAGFAESGPPFECHPLNKIFRSVLIIVINALVVNHAASRERLVARLSGGSITVTHGAPPQWMGEGGWLDEGCSGPGWSFRDAASDGGKLLKMSSRARGW